MGFFSGKKPTLQQYDIFGSPQKQKLDYILSMLFSAGGQGGGGQGLPETSPIGALLGGGGGFAPMAQEARTQFGQQTIPSIMERFSAMDGQRSSAFPQYLGQAGAGLEQGLATEGAKFGQRERSLQIPLIQTLLGLAFQPQKQSVEQPGTRGFLGQMGSLLQTGMKYGAKSIWKGL